MSPKRNENLRENVALENASNACSPMKSSKTAPNSRSTSLLKKTGVVLNTESRTKKQQTPTKGIKDIAELANASQACSPVKPSKATPISRNNSALKKPDVVLKTESRTKKQPTPTKGIKDTAELANASQRCSPVKPSKAAPISRNNSPLKKPDVVLKTESKTKKQPTPTKRTKDIAELANASTACSPVNFQRKAAEGPIIICMCCGCKWFSHQVKHKDKFLRQLTNCTIPVESYQVIDSSFLCLRCFNNLKKNKLCPIALSNGLMFPEVPKCISDLSLLEERMVSPIVPFMQLRELLPHSLNSQLSLKGSVVHQF